MKRLTTSLVLSLLCLCLLAQTKLIKVGLDNNYPPYEFVDKFGQVQGFNIELLKIIETYTSMKFDFHPDSWEHIVKRYDNGELDMLSGMFLSEERAKENFFSIPHSRVSYKVFYHKDKRIIDIDNLSDKKLLVQKNDIMHSYLSNRQDLNLVLVRDPEEAILRLRFSEFDGAVISLGAGNYFVDKHELRDILVNPQPILNLNYCYAAKFENKEVIDEINEILLYLISTGKYNDLHAKWYNQHTTFEKYKPIIMLLITSLLIILILFSVWFFIARKRYKIKHFELEQEKIIAENLRYNYLHNMKVYDRLVSVLNEGIWEWDFKTGKAVFSKNYYLMLGYEENDFEASYNSWKELLHPDERQVVIKKIFDTFKSGKQIFEIIFRLRKKDNSYIWVLGRGIISEYDENNKPSYLVGIHSDISSQKKLEEQLNQSQKMDALGRLSSVIAHDFNNLITSILGNTDIALSRLGDNREIKDRLDIIRNTCSKAKQLTKKLTMMSKKQENHPIKLDVSQAIDKNLNIIERLLGEDIKVEFIKADDNFEIFIDNDLFDQVILNLCVNAKEAMLSGGRLAISTERIYLDSAYIKYHSSLIVGNYILISISDTGTGMDSEMLKRIFDPFYSTKQSGSGLGLTIVYNIISQAKGDISVYSEKGIGSVFKLFLPEYSEDNIILEEENTPPYSIREYNQLSVIVIEDDESILTLIKDVLTKEGFNVKTFLSDNGFLEYIAESDPLISFMLIDIILPDVRGYRIKELLPQNYSDVPIIYMSGYPKDMIMKEFDRIRFEHLILKPFSPKELLVKINEIIKQ